MLWLIPVELIVISGIMGLGLSWVFFTAINNIK